MNKKSQKVLAECKVTTLPDRVNHIPVGQGHDYLIDLIESYERLNAEVQMLAESLGVKVETKKQKDKQYHIKIKEGEEE